MINKKISVILPAYNEARHIVSNLMETVETLSSFEYDYEVILVDDGSPDNTYLHAAKVLVSHPERVRILRYEENQGKGNALICGAKYAYGEYIAFLDADMDLHPSQLPLLLEIMEANGADAVIGSKWHPLSKVAYPFVRCLLSRAYYGFVRLLFGLPLRDTQTGLKVFRAHVLRKVFPRIMAKRFAFDIEVLANIHRLGYKIAEAPVTLDFMRKIGRIRTADVKHTFLDTCAIWYRMHVLHYYDRDHDGFISGEDASPAAREIALADIEA